MSEEMISLKKALAIKSKLLDFLRDDLEGLSSLSGYELQDELVEFQINVDGGKYIEIARAILPKVTGNKASLVDYSHDHTEQLEMASQGNPALASMVGGSHYNPNNKIIQPVEFYHANPQLNFQQTNMIKYAYRHKDKNKAQDLLKVVHYALLECGFEYPEEYDNFRNEIRKLLGE